MKILLIGGTGTISLGIVNKIDKIKNEIYLLNRGNKKTLIPEGVKSFIGDMEDEAQIAKLIASMEFDVVADFIAFSPDQIERDIRLFEGKTKQFIFISSASAYKKPAYHYKTTEDVMLDNPYWEYSREKAACEEVLKKAYKEKGFPFTIVRPSHTYDERSVPLGIHGDKGSWQVVRRMMEGKKVIIQGDGTSLWTATHTDDFAKGFIGLMGNPRAIGEAVHITTDEVLTWNQIYQAMADALHVELKAVHISSEMLAMNPQYDLTGTLLGDKANCAIFDNGKLKSLVPEFVATTKFHEGIAKTIAYILENREYQRKDEDFDRWCDQVIGLYEEWESKMKQLL